MSRNNSPSNKLLNIRRGSGPDIVSADLDRVDNCKDRSNSNRQSSRSRSYDGSRRGSAVCELLLQNSQESGKGSASPSMSPYMHRNRRKANDVPMTLLSATPSSDVTDGIESELFDAVAVGDLPTVQEILAREPGKEFNTKNSIGQTALRLAVENEHESIVQVLLDRTGKEHLYDAFQMAITLGHTNIAKKIFQHKKYPGKDNDNTVNSDGKRKLDRQTSLFAPEATPLILAAQHNRYEVIKMLIDAGMVIEVPHDSMCECEECDLARHDELSFARSRLLAYAGLCSEAYICLSSSDPILTAFELRQDIMKLAENEKHYLEEYLLIEKKLSQFCVDLLDNVRGNDELDVILNAGEDDAPWVTQGNGSLSRLRLALKYKETGFVAHPSCQRKITSIWYMTYNPDKAIAGIHSLSTVLLAIGFPIFSLLYWIPPFADRIRYILSIPFLKFVGQTSSYIVFLILITLFSLTEKATEGQIHHVQNSYEYATDEVAHMKTNSSGNFEDVFVRPLYPSFLEIAIVVFVLGNIWQECKQLYSVGAGDHFNSVFNILDWIMLSLYMTSFLVKQVVFYKVNSSLKYFTQEGSFWALHYREEEAVTALYWIMADRSMWSDLDPQRVCEGLFAIGNVLSFVRLFYLLAANEHLGPLQVSLGRMLKDIMKFMAIFLIIFIAFVIALNNLYWYYNPTVLQQINVEYGSSVATPIEAGFSTVSNSFLTAFWTIFGIAPDIFDDDQNVETGFTETVGIVLFGLYNAATIIVLINMLIAMMTRSFDMIQNDAHVVWKFARAELYMELALDQSFLPVPFNIIPSPYSIYNLFKTIYEYLSSCNFYRKKHEDLVVHAETYDYDSTDRAERYNIRNNALNHQDSRRNTSCGCGFRKKLGQIELFSRVDNFLRGFAGDKDAVAVEKTNLSYESIIYQVVRRYIFESEKVEVDNVEADLEDLKLDFSSFRYDVFNVLEIHRKGFQHSLDRMSAKLDIALAHPNSRRRESPASSKDFAYYEPYNSDGEEELIVPVHINNPYITAKGSPIDPEYGPPYFNRYQTIDGKPPSSFDGSVSLPDFEKSISLAQGSLQKRNSIRSLPKHQYIDPEYGPEFYELPTITIEQVDDHPNDEIKNDSELKGNHSVEDASSSSDVIKNESGLEVHDDENTDNNNDKSYNENDLQHLITMFDKQPLDFENSQKLDNVIAYEEAQGHSVDELKNSMQLPTDSKSGDGPFDQHPDKSHYQTSQIEDSEPRNDILISSSESIAPKSSIHSIHSEASIPISTDNEKNQDDGLPSSSKGSSIQNDSTNEQLEEGGTQDSAVKSRTPFFRTAKSRSSKGKGKSKRKAPFSDKDLRAILLSMTRLLKTNEAEQATSSSELENSVVDEASAASSMVKSSEKDSISSKPFLAKGSSKSNSESEKKSAFDNDGFYDVDLNEPDTQDLEVMNDYRARYGT